MPVPQSAIDVYEVAAQAHIAWLQRSRMVDAPALTAKNLSEHEAFRAAVDAVAAYTRQKIVDEIRVVADRKRVPEQSADGNAYRRIEANILELVAQRLAAVNKDGDP